ncbi:MAG: DegT/DnrJ/EryC1/StrS family aminotransferase, partial [Candidatus Dormibacteraceae bacterium]
IQERRQRIWDYYYANLRSLALTHGLKLPFAEPHCRQAYHMFYLLTRSLDERTALIRHLKERGIHAVFHYVPLHLSEMGVRFGGRQGTCPVTEIISDRLLRLPFHNTLTQLEQDQVIDALIQFYAPAKRVTYPMVPLKRAVTPAAAEHAPLVASAPVPVENGRSGRTAFARR